MNTRAIIDVSDLWFSYDGTDGADGYIRHPGQAVLQGLELEIPAGSITAILGPNGSGKTTLLHLILGLLSPGRGTIWLAGRPQASYSRREMGRLMALVPQSEAITFNFSVLEYVLMGRAPYLGPLEMPRPADRQVAVEALEVVGAGTLRDRSVSALSGGEHQLIILARALAQEPRILLLDEPTSHLDLGNQERILRILRRLSAAGVTVVLTTHDPNVAAAVADTVVLMKQGEVWSAAPAASALTAHNLSAVYGVPVLVLQAQDRLIICLATFPQGTQQLPGATGSALQTPPPANPMTPQLSGR